MIKKHMLLSLLMIASSIRTGVYILAELPKEVTAVIQEAQDTLFKKVSILNAQENAGYIFQNAQFSPHLSLAFVSQEQLSIKEVKDKFPDLIEKLQQIVREHTSINMSNSFADAAIDYWPGKFEVECDGSKKKNYLNVVLKLNNNRELANLAEKISKTLEDNYTIKQGFPFSAHLTIGRICDKNDKPLDPVLKQKLETLASNTETRITDSKQCSILIEELKLKGHDGSEEKFFLLKND